YGCTHLRGNAWALATRVVRRSDDAEIASEVDRDVCPRLRVERLRTNELAPLGGAGSLLRCSEDSLGIRHTRERNDRDAAALWILVLCTMSLEPCTRLGLRHIGGRHCALACFGEHRVAQDATELLLRERFLVVALRDSLSGEELDDNHLVEKLL